MRGMKIYHNNLTSMDHAFNHQKKEVLAIVFLFYSLAMALVEEIIHMRQKGADQRTVPALAQQLRSRFVHEINGEKHNHYRSYCTLQPNEYQQESYKFLEQCSSQEFFYRAGGGGGGCLAVGDMLLQEK